MKDLLDRLEAAASKAPAGPYHYGHINENNGYVDIHSFGYTPELNSIVAEEVEPRFAEYIALCSPENITKLIKAIVELEHKLNQAREIIEHWKDICDCGCKCGDFYQVDADGNPVMITCPQCAAKDWLEQKLKETS